MKLKDWLAFVVLGTLWGSSFMWIKIAVQEISPVMLVAIRLSFAIITLVGAAVIARQNMPKQRHLWIMLTVFGFFNVCLPYLLISWGQQYIDSAVAAILNSTTPLFAMLIAHRFLDDDRITIPRLIGLIVGFIGIIILISRDLGRSNEYTTSVHLIVLGQLAVLAASLLYAGSAVYARGNLKGLSPIVQGLIPLLGSTALLWALVGISESPVTLPEIPITWISLAWLGILGSGIAFLLYFYLIHSVGPTRTTLVTYVFPLVGIALGVIFLNESLDLRLALGALLVLGSIVVVNSSK